MGHSPENRRKRRTALVVSAGLGLSAVTACSSTSGYNSTHPSFNTQVDTVDRFMASLYKDQKVQKCIGKLGLKQNGHVRTYPFASNGGLGTPLNAVEKYSNNSGEFVLNDPKSINVYDDNSTVSSTWYVTKLANGDLAFTNKDATNSLDNLVCKENAAPTTPDGTIVAE